jgi:hypothetical protein
MQGDDASLLNVIVVIRRVFKDIWANFAAGTTATEYSRSKIRVKKVLSEPTVRRR